MVHHLNLHMNQHMVHHLNLHMDHHLKLPQNQHMVHHLNLHMDHHLKHLPLHMAHHQRLLPLSLSPSTRPLHLHTRHQKHLRHLRHLQPLLRDMVHHVSPQKLINPDQDPPRLQHPCTCQLPKLTTNPQSSFTRECDHQSMSTSSNLREHLPLPLPRGMAHLQLSQTLHMEHPKTKTSLLPSLKTPMVQVQLSNPHMDYHLQLKQTLPMEHPKTKTSRLVSLSRPHMLKPSPTLFRKRLPDPYPCQKGLVNQV